MTRPVGFGVQPPTRSHSEVGSSRRRPSVPRPLALAAATLIAIAAIQLLAITSPAGAGEYTVRQCANSGHQGFTGMSGILGGVDRVDFVNGCTSVTSDRVGVHQDRSGRNFGEGVGGEYRWTAPSESLITAARLVVKMKNANGIIATPVGVRQNGEGVSLDGGSPHDGTQVTANWRDPGDPLRWAAARLICRRAGGCANKPDSTKAFITLFDAEFTLVDNTPPRMTPGGSLFQWLSDSNWHRGPTEARIDASDGGGGVSSTRVQVNGSWLNVGSSSCPGSRGSFATSMAPCPSSVSGSEVWSTNASPFRDGPNTIRFCADDYHNSDDLLNQVCTYPENVWIDNQAPAPPIGLHAVGGSDWRPRNGFSFAWEEPGDQLAPIAGGSYKLIATSSGQTVEEGPFQARRGLGPLFMPAPGEYELQVRLRDSAGNLGSPAVTRIRFDDRPPGDVIPEPPSGWISADELPLRQVVEKAEARGPSGVAGYALSVSDEGPGLPCPSGLCIDPPFALTGGADDRIGNIPDLSEGSHWISAVAASGAAVSSETPGNVEVKVDRTAPRVALTGVPGTWTNRPVTITATATDTLSGMLPKPDDDGRPETVIQAEGFTPYRVPGPSASFTVTAEGLSMVRYWARDLAGNISDRGRNPDGSHRAAPGEALVRIDTEPPEMRFVDARDPSDPERVDLAFRDSASGIGTAEVSLRRIGAGGPFRPIATAKRSEEGLFSARVPSDDLPAGSYELRATGTDRAGNTTTSDRTVNGSPMLLRLPLKRVTRLKVGLGKRSSRRARAKFGGRPVVRGRLSVGEGGLSAVPLRILETFDPGSHPSERARTIRTDGTGRFEVKLPPGPSRSVRVDYAGDRTRTRSRSRVLRIESSGRIRFRLRPNRVYNRGHVVMKGRVARRGAVIPARGKLVAIQYFDPSRSKWRPVEVLRTRRNGSFRYRYRFRTIASAQRIIFRAVSLKEAGWPFLHSTSAARSVIVFPSR